MTKFPSLLIFYPHFYPHLLSNYNFLPLIELVLSWFFHLINLSLIQFVLYFFHLAMVYLIHNLKYQILFQQICNVFINIICFYVYNETIIHQRKKKPFSKSFFAFILRSVLISIHGFSQAFWLNLMTFWSFFKTNPWFNAYFKFLMCIKYSALSCKLATSFLTFSIFVLSGKKSKSLWRLCKFSGYWTSTKRKYSSSLSLL